MSVPHQLFFWFHYVRAAAVRYTITLGDITADAVSPGITTADVFAHDVVVPANKVAGVTMSLDTSSVVAMVVEAAGNGGILSHFLA